MTVIALTTLTTLATLAVGCAEVNPAPAPSPVSASAPSAQAPKVSKPVTEMVEIRDPVEDCFTVSVPKGWHNRAYSARAYDVHREVVTSVSPNSDTVLFLGDPSIPQYWNPSQANPMTYEFARVNPMMKIEPPQAAEQYFSAYTRRKFGKLQNFKLGTITENVKTVQSMQAMLQKNGIQGHVSAVDVPFTYQDKSTKMSAHLVGISIDFGGFWIVDVSGVSTAGKASDFLPMLSTMAKSKKTNPQWTAKQQALHQQRMDQIRAHGEMMNAQHQRNMEWIQASATRHQQRMQAIWASNDASMKSYYERSASSDLQHQRFLNYINDENTVVGSGGKTWQVDSSYQRYFVHKRNNTYLAGDIRFDADEIRRRGLNPDDYEEVKIRN